MKSVITNAAELTVLEPIDNTYKTGGGPVSVGGCVILAAKGRPFTVHEIFGVGTSQEDTFGSPLPKKAYGMEGLRHLSEAVKECNWVQAVRVVNQQEYRYPSLGFLMFRNCGEWDSQTDYVPGDVVSCDGKEYIAAADVSASATPPVTGTGEWLEYSGPVEKDAHRHNESVIVGDDGFWLVVYPIDGDASTRRTVRFEDVDKERRRFKLAFYDVDDTGYEYALESHLVGIGEDDKDDMGRPAYIETVLETQSKRFRCDFLEGTTWEALEPVLLALEDKKATPRSFGFEGGASGGQPENDDWFKAVELLRRESMPLNMIFAAGITEQDIIARLAEIADFRHIGFFFDVPSYLPQDSALEWLRELGLNSRHARAYYASYEASDPWRGGKTVWGVSGAMAAAKARGNAIFTKNVPGIHYSPAGEKRGYLSRTGVAPLFPEQNLNRDTFYTARLNPVIDMASGGACADDDLTQFFRESYLRFGWINDVLDYIDQRFLEAARIAKFEPDGLTREILYDLLKTIMDELVTSGALVQPREPDKDGTKPYIITITQVEIDLWHCEWAVCITGAARRIAGQPRLMR